jgi:hypothetical protein
MAERHSINIPPHQQETSMTTTQTQELIQAVQLYLDLMHDCDVGKFDRVFCSTSWILNRLNPR